MKVLFINRKVRKDFENLGPENIASASILIKSLKVKGSLIRMPHSKPLSKGLFELRNTDSTKIRLIYTFYRDSAVILVIFVKKTERLPGGLLKLARNRKKLLD